MKEKTKEIIAVILIILNIAGILIILMIVAMKIQQEEQEIEEGLFYGSVPEGFNETHFHLTGEMKKLDKRKETIEDESNMEKQVQIVTMDDSIIGCIYYTGEGSEIETFAWDGYRCVLNSKTKNHKEEAQ